MSETIILLGKHSSSDLIKTLYIDPEFALLTSSQYSNVL